MKRKKFIKLMMSFGIPRNIACQLADNAVENHTPYIEAFMDIVEWFIVNERGDCVG